MKFISAGSLKSMPALPWIKHDMLATKSRALATGLSAPCVFLGLSQNEIMIQYDQLDFHQEIILNKVIPQI